MVVVILFLVCVPELIELLPVIIDWVVVYTFPLKSNHLSLTVSPMDYAGLSTILMFSACETRQCLNVTVFEDQVLEETESFNAVLNRTDNLDTRITLNPVNAAVYIIDNDSKLSSENVHV